MSSVDRTLQSAICARRRFLFGKRFFDLFFSLLMMGVFFPLFLAIVFGIRLSSKGKAIYAQDRLGQSGKVFKCLKFRTMTLNAEEQLLEILHNNPALKMEWQLHQKLRDDPRIFSFGKWLRKTSLDELPQFWNVLKGDMSVVGPRPYTVDQYKDLGCNSPKILSMRPGVTGIWQTQGRSSTTFEKRMELDAKYVDEGTFWNDLVLTLKTLSVLTKDAY